MRIVHFSDWHTRPRNVPWADVYVCTGDMLEPSTPFPKYVDFQRKWLKEELEKGSYRQYFENSGAPVVCVRGNHDFIDIAPLFGGLVYEIQDPSVTFTINDIVFGGFRGVPIINYKFSDEMDEEAIKRRLDLVPNNVNVMLSHGPPKSILDSSYGSIAYLNWLQERWLEDYVLKACLFGHIHESKGTDTLLKVQFSNAATGFNVIDI